ncbi:MAG: LysE family transporter [Lentimicrobiaceae bacterium]|nr:LysE family transporter [Lentimicrobiaceae bacterium]MCB9023979.1 LysE family transporter [Lentimicrobiaceae bacterium]MCO5265590.1 LysE family transporter [Lentimicrobium sp.]HPG32837.1 LysE family transporter [Lentimicrobium sp.]
MHPFFEGMILGMTLAIMLGPAMFSLIQTSIHRGLSSGILLAGGIFLSDLSLVVLCYLGAVQVIGNDRNYLMFGIIGGIVLMIFGVVTFLRKVQIADDNNLIDVKMPGPLTYIFKGFFLNFANPFVWIFWVSVMVSVSSGYGTDSWSIKAFFLGSLLTIFSTDILKVIIASRLKRYLKPRILIMINHLVGILLVLFGIYLMIRTFINF